MYIARENVLSLVEQLENRYIRAFLIKQINAIPSVNVVFPKYGEWIDREGPDADGNVEDTCSICGHGNVHDPSIKTPYCWYCGASMCRKEE